MELTFLRFKLCVLRIVGLLSWRVKKNVKKSGLKIEDCRAGDLRAQEFNVKTLSG